MTKLQEQESNLIVVSATEEYASRHNMKVSDVLLLFKKHNVFKMLRSQYDVLHMLALEESADFVEEFLSGEQ